MEINTLNNFVCKICNKTYSSNSGLWKHNKNKHPNNNIVINQDTAKLQQNAAELMQNFQNLQQNAVKMYQKDFICKFCNYKFTRNSSLKTHNDRCKLKNNETNKIKIELEELKKEYSHLKNKVETLEKTEINNNNNTTNNNTNNNTTNNNNNIYHIYSFGDEKLEDILTEKVILKILSMGFNSLQYFIDYVSKHPEFNNIQVTNLRSNTAYIVDKVSKMFVPTNQADAVKTLTTDRMDNIMEYHEMYAEKIPQKTDNRLNELKDDFEKNPDRHYSDTRYTLYKNSQRFNEVKKKEIKIK
jgi:hypothetical protein